MRLSSSQSRSTSTGKRAGRNPATSGQHRRAANGAKLTLCGASSPAPARAGPAHFLRRLVSVVEGQGDERGFGCARARVHGSHESQLRNDHFQSRSISAHAHWAPPTYIVNVTRMPKPGSSVGPTRRALVSDERYRLGAQAVSSAIEVGPRRRTRQTTCGLRGPEGSTRGDCSACFDSGRIRPAGFGVRGSPC